MTSFLQNSPSFGNSTTLPTINGKCNFLKALLTQKALNTCNNEPGILVIALLAILGLITVVSIAVWIHFATMKDSQKKKKPVAEKKGGSGGGSSEKRGFLKGFEVPKFSVPSVSLPKVSVPKVPKFFGKK